MPADSASSSPLRRIVPPALLGALGGCFALSLLTFMVLGAYTHPAKDDYLSAVMFREADLGEALATQYRLHNGRLVSALIMRLSPLQFHSFSGYKIACTLFVLLFAAALLVIIYRSLRSVLHPLDRLAVFFVAYLCLHGALGDLAEFYYWLPAISCYGITTLLFLPLLAVLPGAVRSSGRAATRSALIAAIIGFVIPFCGEPGAVMSLGALAIVVLHAQQQGRLNRWRAAGLCCVILAGFTLAALAPGNALRLATTPHSRSIVQTLAGGAYTMSGDLLRLGFHFLPAALFCGGLMLSRAGGLRPVGQRLLHFLLITALFWGGGELLAFWGIGGVPALRVRNAFIFLASCLVFVSVALAFRRPGVVYGAANPGHKLVIGLSGAWICLSIFISGNPVRAGLQDLLSGTAQRYDHDMKRMYAEASQSTVREPVLKVSPVRVIPASLFVAQPLILADEIKGWPWFNVHMAEYFGHQRLYTDSLANVPSSDEAFQEWLKARRAASF